MVPIASLTKMMTTWVILHRLPLTFTQRGPCLIVDSHDVALYNYDVATDQSNARIVLGENICEGTLFRGLLVHSAGDYAQLLLRLVHLSGPELVAMMNHDAKRLGLNHTHYVDITGISPGDRSSASDQAKLAYDLMRAEPIVDRIVAMPTVTLPYAGLLGSYTPYVGAYGVIGVKSGLTGAAGGTDVMATKMIVDHTTIIAYAVVLSQFGSNPLLAAGNAALTLSRSLRMAIAPSRSPHGIVIKWRGPS